MQGEFDGRIALVAGAAGGMGKQIALDLLEAGAKVAGCDVAAAPQGFEAYGDRWLYVQGDLARRADVETIVTTCLETFGGIELVANTVGVLWFDRDKTLIEIDEQIWDQVLAINLKPMIWLTRTIVPIMRARGGGGAFVHFSSIDGTGGDAVPQDAYGASKAAMLRMSKSIALQFAKDNIRSNVILPGSVLTPMQERWESAPDDLRLVEASVPLGRVGTARDMSNAALFLLSDRASYVTGAELIVDGGITAGV